MTYDSRTGAQDVREGEAQTSGVYSLTLFLGATEEELIARTTRTYKGSLEVGYDLARFEIGRDRPG